MGLTGDLSVGNTLNVCDTANASGDLSVEENLNACCRLQNRPTALFTNVYLSGPTGTTTISLLSSYFASEPTPPTY
jgi:hypothetical protein